MFKVNIQDTRMMSVTPVVFVIKSEHITYLFLLFLLTLKMCLFAGLGAFIIFFQEIEK